MNYKELARQFFFMFFGFFGLRTIGDVLLRTPEETSAHLYSAVPYVSALLLAVITTAYTYYTNRKKEKKEDTSL